MFNTILENFFTGVAYSLILGIVIGFAVVLMAKIEEWAESSAETWKRTKNNDTKVIKKRNNRSATILFIIVMIFWAPFMGISGSDENGMIEILTAPLIFAIFVNTYFVYLHRVQEIGKSREHDEIFRKQ